MNDLGESHSLLPSPNLLTRDILLLICSLLSVHHRTTALGHHHCATAIAPPPPRLRPRATALAPPRPRTILSIIAPSHWATTTAPLPSRLRNFARPPPCHHRHSYTLHCWGKPTFLSICLSIWFLSKNHSTDSEDVTYSQHITTLIH